MNPARQADSRHEAPTHTPFASPLSLLPSWAAGSYEYDDAGCGDVLRSEPRCLASMEICSPRWIRSSRGWH